MMAKKKVVFAKIIELKDYQVLVFQEYDDEDDEYKLRQVTGYDGMRATISACFKDEKKCESAFASYNGENAQKFIDSLKEMFN